MTQTHDCSKECEHKIKCESTSTLGDHQHVGFDAKDKWTMHRWRDGEKCNRL